MIYERILSTRIYVYLCVNTHKQKNTLCWKPYSAQEILALNYTYIYFLYYPREIFK